MRIWVDLSNSPHPLLFAPIADRLASDGHELLITARDNAQTVELAREIWPDVVVLGGESPRGRAGKGMSLATRTAALLRFARQRRPDVALSHNSYSQISAARLAGVRSVTAMDYEFQPANNLAFRAADRVLLPCALRTTAVSRQGASARKTRYYPGYKEELYIGAFEPNEAEVMRVDAALRSASIRIVVRTPPSRATYHRGENPLFWRLLHRFGRLDDAVCVVLARHEEQRVAIENLGLRSVVVPRTAVDSRSLLYYADYMFGAGGTMTREAALLGVPTYSLFAGRLSAVDESLMREGRLRRLTTESDVPALAVTSRERVPLTRIRERCSELVDWFVHQALPANAHNL